MNEIDELKREKEKLEKEIERLKEKLRELESEVQRERCQKIIAQWQNL